MHAYLQDQAIGMVQVESLAVFDANGILMANSVIADPPELRIDVVNDPAFRSLRQGRGPQLSIAAARPALFKPETWVFPIARRLETPGGAFGGVVFAGGRVEYFEQFYRDLRLGEGTAVTLLHRDGTLLARHPSAPAALGQRYAAIDDLMMAGTDTAEGPRRAVSPIDGVDRFGVVEGTPDYPLAVVVTRDATVALRAWREQAIGTMTHTLVLGLLSALLLAMVARQFARLDQARASLEHSRERFALGGGRLRRRHLGLGRRRRPHLRVGARARDLRPAAGSRSPAARGVVQGGAHAPRRCRGPARGPAGAPGRQVTGLRRRIPGAAP